VFTTRLVNPLFLFNSDVIVLSSVSLVFIRAEQFGPHSALTLDHSLVEWYPCQVGRLREEDLEGAAGGRRYGPRCVAVFMGGAVF